MKKFLWTTTTMALLATSSAFAGEEIVAAADVGYTPYAIATSTGAFEGMDIDIARAMEKYMDVKIKVIDQPWSATIPGLKASKFDMILAPATITEERAASGLAYTEGYADAVFSFLVKADGLKVDTLEDLRGKVVATNKGNIFDRWLTKRKDKYGWTVNRFDKYSDAAAAVAVGQADAAMMYTAAAGWLSKQNAQFSVSGHTVNEGRAYGYIFRADSADLRAKVDAAIECVKLSGEMAVIYERWTGIKPAADSLSYTTVPGYGPVGISNYDDTKHEMDCG